MSLPLASAPPVAIEIATLALTDEGVGKAVVRAVAELEACRPGKLRETVWAALRIAARERLGAFAYNQVENAFRRLKCGHRADRSKGERAPLMASLEMLAKRYLTTHKGQLALRFDHLIEAQSVLRRVNVCLLRAYALLGGCHQQDPWKPPSDDVLRQYARDAILPPPAYLLLDELARQGLVETHRHMNLSTLAPIVWASWMEGDPTDRGKSERDGETWDEDLARMWRIRKLRGELIHLVESYRSSASSVDVSKLREILERGLKSAYGARTYRGIVGEFLLISKLMRCLCWLQDRRDAYELAVVEAAAHVYFIDKCWFMGRVQQSLEGSRGLNRFVELYSGSVLRATDDNDTPRRLIQAYRTGRVFWLEGRWRPKDAARCLESLKGCVSRRRMGQGPVSLLKLLRGSKRMTSEEILTPDGLNSLPGVGCIFHFVKSEENRGPSKKGFLSRPAARDEKSRLDGWVEAEGVVDVLKNRDLRPLLLGLDVAGREASTCCGAFAPQIRYLRWMSRQIVPRSYLDLVRRSPNEVEERNGIRVTCHGGEDFNHILGGLRHMEEAIRFLDLEEGDRIGHGIALGLSPATWRDAFGGAVQLRVGEWLDDLVWLRGALGKSGVAPGVLIEVENDIHRYSGQIYGKRAEGSELEDAWLLRAEDPIVARAVMNVSVPEDERDARRWLEDRLDDLCHNTPMVFPGYRFALRSLKMALGRGPDEKRVGSHRERVLRDGLRWWLRYHFDQKVRNKWNDIIEVEIKKSWIEAIEAAQALLMEMVVQRKVVIEVNPSSNLTLSPIGKLWEHPVFRWLDPRKGAEANGRTPFVVIGTDDPGVFCTELLHEYALLARAAEELGASPRQIRDWLMRLRQSSIEFSFFPKKAFEQLDRIGADRS